MNETVFNSNRSAWNQATEYHQKARSNSLQAGFVNPDFTVFNRDCDGILLNELSGIDLRGKIIAQVPCNNGRELLSLMRFGAKEAVGFDISDAAVKEAEQLAEIAKLKAKFERINILEIGAGYDNYFDFIYVSEGSLQWFPDLDAYFSVINRLLKTGGRVLVFEIHPFAYIFENGFDPKIQNWNEAVSYFSKGPYNYKNGMDYIGGIQYETGECYWFAHKIPDVIKAVLRNGIEILDFDEYNLEMANNHTAKLYDKFPLSYILAGRKQ